MIEDDFKFRKHIINYLDIVLRGLISFTVLGLGLGIILIGFLKMKAIYVFPIIFLFSVFLSPLLSKVKLGEKLLVKFEKFLSKLFKIK